ncbi:hypothetical protein FXV83_38340 [Bradyrhizobium hipponense]|uniref:Uncharacterized protein n=1 Tax=Bradyrhizobium hipponense TaxID=2605638 RepID=A0A5S4YD07_9BRAD|nr:hypothetical protein [Bradyrhizobium hipponense]TYO61377.1 hypothetical protein FXV83_38340 [Bradyrhizobium hipponense]
MTIELQECKSIVEQFKSQHRLLMMRHDIHGIQINVEGDPVLEIVVDGSAEESLVASAQRVPDTFEYAHEGQTKSIPTVISRKAVPRAHSSSPARKVVPETGIGVRGGDEAWGSGLNGHGTVGWSFYLDGVPVCLSNWHVFCANGNQTPLGTPIFLKGVSKATLYMFQSLEASGNSFDLALGRYNDPADALAEMRACEDGSTRPYPMALTPYLKGGDGATYFKVGARPPTCRSGTLRAAGTRKIKYDDGERWFDWQLIFSKMSDAIPVR